MTVNATQADLKAARFQTLPELILHPFADPNGPDKLLESSRASMKIQGLLPWGEENHDDLNRTLLEGRFAEIRSCSMSARTSSAG
jgi:hypothetical protein